ncbi:MAG: N-acetylglucosamine-6-phosphate deacetylase, partial [Opitutaceae bacterium]
MSHGLFDLQVNGFAGVDFQRPEITRADLDRAAEALRRHQTTGILFTLITDTIDALAAQLERVERFRAESASVREMIAGYHIEGPYLLPEPGYHGAHDPWKMKAPDRAEFDRLQR